MMNLGRFGGNYPWLNSVKKGVEKLTKKKPVFGQLTLTGDLALDWMRDGTETEVAKVHIGPIGAFQNYNVPDWAAEKTGEIALLFHPNGFACPILVTQRTILRALEIWCVEMEEKGAKTSVEKAYGIQFGVLDLQEGSVKLHFTRDMTKGEFAPYEMSEV